MGRSNRESDGRWAVAVFLAQLHQNYTNKEKAIPDYSRKALFYMVGPLGLEPRTKGL
jgi:hypothetical protein